MNKKVSFVSAMIICVFFVPYIYAGNSVKAPGVAILDSLSNKYGAVRFDHAKHTGLAGNCGTCHHQHGTNGALSCKECHSVTPAMFKNSVVNNFMACRNCHNDFDPANPGMPALKTAYHVQCFQCHKGMGDVGEDPKGCTQMCHEKK